MAASQKQPESSQNALSEYSQQPSPKPDLQEIKCILCGRLMKKDSDQYVADRFLRGLEREDQRHKTFGHFARKEATIRHQGQEWPALLRIASLSVEEVWCGDFIRARFINSVATIKETDAIVFVLSLNNVQSFYWFSGTEVMDGTIELDGAAPPQFAKVMVATYADPRPETWAVREEQVSSLAVSYGAELVLISETDFQRGSKVLEDVAEKIIAWRVADGRRRDEEEARNTKLNIQLDFN